MLSRRPKPGPQPQARPGEQPQPDEERRQWPSLRDLARYSEVTSWVLGVAAGLVLLVWAGYQADRRWGTGPYLTVAGAVVAVVWAVASLIGQVARWERRRRHPRAGSGKGSGP